MAIPPPTDGHTTDGHTSNGHTSNGHLRHGSAAWGDAIGRLAVDPLPRDPLARDPLAADPLAADRHPTDREGPGAGTRPHPAPVYPGTPPAPSGLVLLAAVWLVVSRFVFNYPAAGSGIGGAWNGVFIGAVVALVAIAQMLAAMANPVLSLVNAVLGGWMITAPWVFGYDSWTAQPIWSDLATGAVIVTAALAGWSLRTPSTFRSVR